LVGWLVAWLAGWLAGWLVGWLADWLVGWVCFPQGLGGLVDLKAKETWAPSDLKAGFGALRCRRVNSQLESNWMGICDGAHVRGFTSYLQGVGSDIRHAVMNVIFAEKKFQKGWLAGWLAGWFVGWLAGWLVGWLAD
jgi:fructose-specific phosphotransferase system IIC component